MAKQGVIKVENLSKRFGELVAVDSISFEIYEREIFGILGPNGAGKTTALEIIEGLQKPTSGKTFVFGKETHNNDRAIKEKIGIQLQSTSFFDFLNLKEILEVYGSFYPSHQDPMQLLEMVGLKEKAKTVVKKLSGGQKQRFAVVSTLINNPQVVFLDEPTTGLDPQARRNLWEIIETMRQSGKTVILTTHYMDEAQILCDRVAIMDEGKIVALDTPERLIRSLKYPYRALVKTNGRFPLSEVSELKGVVEVRERAEEGRYEIRLEDNLEGLSESRKYFAKKNIKIKDLKLETADLEDVFIHFTGKRLRD